MIAQDVTQLGPRCVFFATTLLELDVQFTPQLEQPTIMVMGCASPDGAGMVEVSDLVDIISPHAASHTMSSGEQLCVLDDHLGAVLVTVVLGTFLWITIKEEDVHAYIVAGDLLMSSVYSRLTGLLTESPFVDDDGNVVTVRMTDIARKLADKPHTSRPRLQKAVKKIDKTIKKIDRSPANVNAKGAIRGFQTQLMRAMGDGRAGGRRRTLTKDGSDFEVIP